MDLFPTCADPARGMHQSPALYPSSSVPPLSSLSTTFDLQQPMMAEPPMQQQIITPAERANPIERTYTTADGKPVKVIDAPEPIAQHRQTFPKDATIDTVISPRKASLRPAKSQIVRSFSERPPSPTRANTSPSTLTSLLAPLDHPVGLFARYTAARETILLLDAKHVSDDRSHATLFYIGQRFFRDVEGNPLFALRKRLFLRRQ